MKSIKEADGHVGGCGSFYAISIASEAFKGLSIIKQHRLVNEALKQEIEGIHGLQVRFNMSNAMFVCLLSCWEVENIGAIIISRNTFYTHATRRR